MSGNSGDNAEKGGVEPLSIACKRVWEKNEAILRVQHDEDGSWQFLCGGDEHTSADAAVPLHAHHVFDLNDDLRVLLDLRVGEQAERTSAQDPWIRRAIHDFGSPADLKPLCAPCGKAGALRLDHRSPSSEDTNSSYNVDPLCECCSVDKNARTPDQWIKALVARFGDAEADAHSVEAGTDRCKVFFPATTSALPSEWPDLAGEVLWAEHLGPDRARLLNVPFVAKGVSRNDVVRVKRVLVPDEVSDPTAAEHYFEFDSVIERAGHSALRVFVSASPEQGLIQALNAAVAEYGCSWESGGGICAIDVPDSGHLKTLLAIVASHSSGSVYADVGSQ